MHKLKTVAALGVTAALMFTGLTASATEENAVWGATYNSNQTVSVGLGFAVPGHVYQITAWLTDSSGFQTYNQTTAEPSQLVAGNPIWGFNATVLLTACSQYNTHFVSGGVYITDLTNGDSVWSATLHSDGSQTYTEYSYFTPVSCGS